MELVIVFGPPAVGKMTVGREICALTGFKLFHNHMTVEPIVEVFGFGTPQLGRLVPEFRRLVMEEAVAADLPGLVFTYVWSLADEDDARGVTAYADIVTKRGGSVRFVELFATLEERLRRNEHPIRLDHKPSKRDLDGSRTHLLDVDLTHVLNTSGELSEVQRVRAHAASDNSPGVAPGVRLSAQALLDQHDYVRIDNTDLEPAAVAEKVVAAFGLPRA